MTKFKKQFLALAYLSFLCNLIYSDPVDNKSNFDSPKQNHKKCSCDFKSCDNKRSRDCCKKHKKDVKSYEKKLGIIRGSVNFNGPLNATITVSSTPLIPSVPNIYAATITPNNENLALVTKGKCFKTDGYSIESFYINKSPITKGDAIGYITIMNIKFNRKFKNPPTVSATGLLAENLTSVVDSILPNMNNALITPSRIFATNITTTGCTLARQSIAYLPEFTGSSSAIKVSPGAQANISSDASATGFTFIASGEFCD